MKLLHQAFVRDGAGSVKLVPEESEDMWHAYNLVREGDRVSATTLRKVVREGAGGDAAGAGLGGGGGGGSGGTAARVRVKLEIAVEGIEFDPEGGTLRLKGRNLTECEHVKLGAYHTLELESGRPFTLTKEAWEQQDVDRIAAACDPAASADVAAVLVAEGLANVCLVGSCATIVKARVEASLPRKRGAAAAGYDKALERFFQRVYEAACRAVDWATVRCVVIAGPGFAKDAFRTFLDEEAQRRGDKVWLENRARIVLAHAPSAYKHALKDALEAPAVAALVADTKACRDAAALAELHRVMASDPSRAMYGPGHVLAAAEMGAVQTLLLSDALFRVRDVAKRRRYSGLVETVKSAGGEALVFSSLHESGEQLNLLSGVAAVLRFPLPELEDMELQEDEEVLAAATQAGRRARAAGR